MAALPKQFLIIILHLFLMQQVLRAQMQLAGTVFDKKDRSALPFCAVAILHSSKGTLANEDGKFILWTKNSDTLIFEHPGYQRKIVPVPELASNSNIFLDQQAMVLQEITVSSDNEWLYELLQQCRNSLATGSTAACKTYFTLQSSMGGQPVELIECYYNANLDASGLRSLVFKNGRAGAAQFGNRYFMNLNSSRVFSSINLLQGHKDMPHSPLEFGHQQLHRKFSLKLLNNSGGAEPIFHLAFEPRRRSDQNFRGELWIAKNSGRLMRISMQCGPTDKHPFLPLFPNGRIVSVTMNINKVFSEDGLPAHLDFQYAIRYEHQRSKTLEAENPDTIFTTSCKGLMYFYDYGKLFYQPSFEYSQDLDDYRKIALLSANENFWEINKGPAYSNTMIESVKYFKKYGELINFNSSGKGHAPQRRQFFENHFIRWSPVARLALKGGRLLSDTTNLPFPAPLHDDRFNLKAQIFMDLNECPDSLQYYTATIFDSYSSWFDLPEKPYTRAFINIYFDLYEIHRRLLESRLQEKPLDAARAMVIYREIKMQADRMSEKYLNEAHMGADDEAMFKWNEYVLAQLGINNFIRQRKN